MMMAYRDVKAVFLDSIQECEREEWDAITGDNMLASYGWLKTVEETFIGDTKPVYIVFKDRKGIIASAPCYIFKRTDLVETVDNVLLGRMKKYVSKVGISFTPAMICCPLYCHGKHLLLRKETEGIDRRVMMNELLDSIENEASKNALPLHFVNISEKEIELIRLLDNRGYISAMDQPLNYLDLGWSTFSDYTKSLKSISRRSAKNIKYEINRNKREGVVIKTLNDPEKYQDRLYEVVNNHHFRHNRRPFMFEKTFFKILKENLGEQARLYVSFKKGVITGVCIFLKKNMKGYVPILGVDHETAGNDFTYFNIGYYRPIMDAISEKMTRLYYGRGMYETKVRRGCKLSDVYTYYRPVSRAKKLAVGPWFSFVSIWNKRKLRDIRMKDWCPPFLTERVGKACDLQT